MCLKMKVAIIFLAVCAVQAQELNDTCAGLRMLGNRRDTTVVDECEVNSECTTLNCTTPAWPPQLLSITVDPCAGEVTYEHNISVTINSSMVVPFQIGGGEVDEANFTLVVNDTGVEFGVCYIISDGTCNTVFRPSFIPLQCDLPTTTTTPDTTDTSTTSDITTPTTTQSPSNHSVVLASVLTPTLIVLLATVLGVLVIVVICKRKDKQG